MKPITTQLAATALLFTIAAPASALIDPALDEEFLAAATRAVQTADAAPNNPAGVQDLETIENTIAEPDVIISDDSGILGD